MSVNLRRGGGAVLVRLASSDHIVHFSLRDIELPKRRRPVVVYDDRMSERAGRRSERPRTAPSLSFWVAGPLAIALLVFVGPGLWFAAWAIEGAILKNELGVLARTHDE